MQDCRKDLIIQHLHKFSLTFSCSFPHLRMWIFWLFSRFSTIFRLPASKGSRGFLLLNLFSSWKKPLSNFHIGSIVVSKLSFLFWKNESWSHRARSTKKNPQWDGDFSIESFYSASFEDVSIISYFSENQNFLSYKHLHKFPLTFPRLFPHLRNKGTARESWNSVHLEEVYILAIVSPVEAYNSLRSDVFTDS